MNNRPTQEKSMIIKARKATNQARKENLSNKVLFQEIKK